MFKEQFNFGINNEEAIIVDPSSYYERFSSFGYLTPAKEGGNLTFQNNGGWVTQVNGLQAQTMKATLSPTEPLIFRMDVPTIGNYKISVTLRAHSNELRMIKIFTNRRHCIGEISFIKGGEKVKREFYTHIAPYVYGVGESPTVEKHIEVSILGLININELEKITIEEASVPTIHIVGDSIATDDEASVPYQPKETWSGWGQHLEQYFSNCAVNNQAHNGMTTVCFRSDGHWKLVLDDIVPGDVILFHFGHNDQKRPYLAPTDGYRNNVLKFIEEAEEKKAVPILVTSLSRIPITDSKKCTYDSLEEYAEEIRKIGLEKNIEVIDLHEKSFSELKNLIKVTDLSTYFKDAAHTNDFGASIVAFWMAKLVYENHQSELRKFVKPENLVKPMFELSEQRIQLVNEQPITNEKPKLNYKDIELLTSYETDMLAKALSLHIIDPCVLYLHPMEPMQKGQFLYALSQVAKPFHLKPYENQYEDVHPHEWTAPYVQAAIESKLINVNFVQPDQLKLGDEIKGEELITMIVRNICAVDERDIRPMECEKIADENKLLWESYESNHPVNRLQCYIALVKMSLLLKKGRG